MMRTRTRIRDVVVEKYHTIVGAATGNVVTYLVVTSTLDGSTGRYQVTKHPALDYTVSAWNDRTGWVRVYAYTPDPEPAPSPDGRAPSAAHAAAEIHEFLTRPATE